MDIQLYGLCVGIAKGTLSVTKESTPDRPVHKQNMLFARGVCTVNSEIFARLLFREFTISELLASS